MDTRSDKTSLANTGQEGRCQVIHTLLLDNTSVLARIGVAAAELAIYHQNRLPLKRAVKVSLSQTNYNYVEAMHFFNRPRFISPLGLIVLMPSDDVGDNQVRFEIPDDFEGPDAA